MYCMYPVMEIHALLKKSYLIHCIICMEITFFLINHCRYDQQLLCYNAQHNLIKHTLFDRQSCNGIVE